MRHALKQVWHRGREYVTHWMVAGAILAATGAAPEHWLADLMHETHLPTDALHLWASGIDLRSVLAGVGLVLIAGDIGWRRLHRPTPSTLVVPDQIRDIAAGPFPESPPVPDKPSIAVLPFDNMSGDPNQEYFSDGVAEDVITELSRCRSLFVIARNSSFTYRGRSVDVALVGRELGVRYVLEGSVRRDGNHIRVTAQLVVAENGHHLWAERFDRDLSDVFVIQDEITRAVVAAIEPAVSDAEQQRALRKPPNSLSAWEAYQQGLWHLSRRNVLNNAHARVLFEKAISLDPLFASAHVNLALTEIFSALFYLDHPLKTMTQAAFSHATRGAALDPNDAAAHATLGWTLVLQGDLDAAAASAARALALNSNSPQAHHVRGVALLFSGQREAAREALYAATRLDPRDPILFSAPYVIAMSYYYDHDYEGCLRVAREVLATTPDHPLAYRYAAASLAQLGRIEEARDALAKMLAATQGSLGGFYARRPPWIREVDFAHILDGLRKAGWQG